MQDQIYQEKKNQIVDFEFDEEVVNVFPDMIRRSVPGYETMISMSGLIIARQIKSNGVVYDLGCSLGASTLAILEQYKGNALRILAVDKSKEMIDKAKKTIRDKRVQFICADVRQLDFESADAILCNFIIQFLPRDDRNAFISKIFKSMKVGATLVVSEKISAPDYIPIHESWKKANGYSALEVSQKRKSLEKIMVVDSEQEHMERFEVAGFQRIHQWYRCLNWASFSMQK